MPKDDQAFKAGDIVRLAGWVTKDDELVVSDGWGPFRVSRASKDGRIIRLARTDGKRLIHCENSNWNPEAFRRDEFLTAVYRAKKKKKKAGPA